MEMIIQIKKAEVFDEIAKLTAYIGAKTIEDTGIMYDRVFVTDDDRVMLESFWSNCLTHIIDACKTHVISYSKPSNSQKMDMNEVFVIHLNMPNNYDHNMQNSLESSARSYCINKITSEWFMITNKTEVEIYIQKSVIADLEITRLLNHRKIPIR